MQIRTGTASVTNASTNVIFSVDDDLSETMLLIAVGNIFATSDAAHQVPYWVGAVTPPATSSSGFWEVTLTAPYLGGTLVGVVYSLTTDFTANKSLPLLNKGDLHPHILLSRAMALLDVFLGTIDPGLLDDRLDALEALNEFDKQVTLSFVADAGVVNATQTEIATAIDNIAPDWALFGGDNTYGADYEDDWAAFSAFNAITLPALGNHDWDRANILTELAALFPTLPGNKRYYDKILGGGLVHLFVLDSSLKTDLTPMEADGYVVGSVQHTWFVAAIAASTAKWKIVMFHHPFVTSVIDSDRRVEGMEWNFGSHGVDLILNGHSHLWEYATYKGVPCLCGGGSTTPHDISTLEGAGTYAVPLNYSLEWVLEGVPCVAKIFATNTNLQVSVWDAVNSVEVFAHNIGQISSNRHDVTFEVLPPGFEDLGIIYPEKLYCGHIPRHFRLNTGASISVLSALAFDVTYYIYSKASAAAAIQIASGTLLAGSYNSHIPLEDFTVPVLREGLYIYMSLDTSDSYDSYPVNGLALSLHGEFLS